MNISVQNITKKYGGQKAVDAISFDVKTGEILGFLGPNGAGKTTTMKMITNYLGADEGDILINGRSITDGSFKSHIGYLPEHNPLYDEMPLMDYLAFCAELQQVNKTSIRDRVNRMVSVCGLDREKHKKISELSKGYKQRVGLAQAMIHDPEILILDEPTTGLDPNQIVEIRKLIKDLGKEKTVILSTHILPEVEATCDRILIINKGQIVADGTAESLRKQAQGQQILETRIVGAAPEKILSTLLALPGIKEGQITNEAENKFQLVSRENKASNEAVFKCCVQNNWILLELIPSETKLEDIFRELTID